MPGEIFFGADRPRALYMGHKRVTAAYFNGERVWPPTFVGHMASHSAMTAALSRVRGLVGDSDALSALGGALSATRPLAGSMASTSALAGNLSVTQDVLLAGQLIAQSAMLGDMSVVRGVVGTLVSTSDAEAAMAVARTLVSESDSSSAMEGLMRIERRLSAELAAQSTGSGDLTVEGSLELSFVTATTSSGSQISIPSIAQENDLAVLFDTAWRGTIGSLSSVVPEDFTTALTGYGENFDRPRRTIVSWKLLEAADPDTNITGMNSENETKTLLVFRPTTPLTSVLAVDPQGITTSNASQIDIDPGATTAVALVLGFIGNNAGGSFSTQSPAFDGIIDNTVNQHTGYTIYNTEDPVAQTVAQADNGFNFTGAVYLAVS